jgi:hypothetical protein
MFRMAPYARRSRSVFQTLLVIFTLICTLVPGASVLAETQPSSSERQSPVRPSDIPSNTLPYTYLAPPTLTSVNPPAGVAAGGFTVVLTGTNFTGATAVSFGGTPATAYTVDSATQITATVPAGTGSIQVTVTTRGGTSNSVSFTYTSGPVITSIAPASGPASGGTTVSLTGLNFTGVTIVSFGGTPATSFTVNSATQITAVAPAGAGAVQVSVTAPTGTSNSVTYTYIGPPVITNLNPNHGPVNGGTAVIITGLNFSGATAVSFGGNPATAFAVNSATQITAVTPLLACLTTVDPCQILVTVTTPSGTSNGVAYTYLPGPAINSLTPNNGPLAGGNTVTINGFSFTYTTAVTIAGVAPTSYSIVSDSQITMVVPAHAAGAVNVTVTTDGGTSNTATYTYVPPPAISSLSPTSGPEPGGTVVTITGTDLLGVTAVAFGSTPATTFTINSATQISASAPAGTGGVQVTVTSSGGVSNGATYTYLPTPTVTGVNPSSGDTGGGNIVTITGTNFTGASAVSFGPTAATTFLLNSATGITAIVPAGTAGAVTVSVTTPNGTGSLPNGYSYFISRMPLVAMPWESDESYGLASAPLAAPALTSIAPNEGPQAGGNSVTIAGSGFTGVNTVRFGAVPATSFTVVSDSQITAVVPPGSGTVQVMVLNSSTLAYSIANVAAAEGNSGTSTLTFAVTLSAASGQPSTVQYSTGGGTATPGSACGAAGVDYVSTSGTLAFNAGETSKTVTVTVCAEATAEADETFILTLSNPTGGATIAVPTATGTIGDDDTPQTVSVGPPTITPNGDGTANARFPVTTAPGSGTSSASSSGIGIRTFLTITVNYSTVDGTAKAGTDYVPTSGTLTYSPGETVKSVDVTVLPNGLDNPNNTFSLKLSAPSNAAIPPGGGESVADVGEQAPVAAAPQVTNVDDDDKPRKETEEQRQQRQRTNRGNRDDVYTGGNVVEVHQDENPPYVVIANRDGHVKVMMECGSQCPKVNVGHYLEADGVKEHEALFYAESVTIKKR